jgi:hypothetical protein
VMAYLQALTCNAKPWDVGVAVVFLAYRTQRAGPPRARCGSAEGRGLGDRTTNCFASVSMPPLIAAYAVTVPTGSMRRKRRDGCDVDIGGVPRYKQEPRLTTLDTFQAHILKRGRQLPEARKGQPVIEERFGGAKTVHGTAPVFLKPLVAQSERPGR